MELKEVLSEDFSLLLDVMGQLAKKNGLRRLRVGEVEIEFWSKESERFSGSVVPKDTLLVENASPDEVDDLFYSVGR